MADYEPWNSGCLGCAQEAMMKERSFELIKQEAEEYAKKNKIDVTIYMEGQEWKYINAATASEIGIQFGREIIRFDHFPNT
jgi:hypothetical protein